MPESIFSFQYNDDQVQERLMRLQQKASDLTLPMNDIGQQQMLSTDQRFVDEKDVQGKPWKPNSMYTTNQKRAAGQIQKILQATGLMRSRTAYNASSDRVVITNNDPKAAKHNYGVGVPKRQFLGVSEQDKLEIIAILDDHILS